MPQLGEDFWISIAISKKRILFLHFGWITIAMNAAARIV